RLASSFSGYDISPDMVRLSLVNMYLHRFAAPRIYEYDTLTSEDRWDEYADVILANPPFMSPKGGIRPHHRFSVKSRRSEVLFVDYMAGHLTPGGRAGIIVPEGVIFQSQKAHTQLRRMLVEDYLVAVVSLPAGVFKPYSGVKASILILDRALARRTDRIAFFKVENDGFDLGDQRRPIDRNDLPQAQAETVEYLRRLRSGEPLDDFDAALGLVVEKARIAADRDYNLSGERYRDYVAEEQEFPWLPLGEITQFFSDGDWIETKDQSEVGIRLIQTGNIGVGEYLDKKSKAKFISEETFQRLDCTEVLPGDVLVSRLPDPVGRACIAPSLGTRQITAVDCSIIRFDQSRLIPELFVAYAKSERYYRHIGRYLTGSTRPRISRSNLAKVQIPLPPLEVQREIVAEIDGYQKVIDGARAVIENYRPHIPINPNWPETTVGESCEVKGGKRLPKGEYFSGTPTKHPYIRVADFQRQSVNEGNLVFISDEIHQQIARYTISSADVYISIAGTIGLIGTIPESLNGANLTENAAKLVFDASRIDGRFLAIVGNTKSVQDQIRNLTHSVGVPKLALRRIKTLRIPLPPLEVQREIADEIESEQAVVNANRELIERFEQKIHAAIGRVWAHDESVAH
ncbi:MAG: N-6 DNA methylase, partial [Chloroflexi bacterium]|nr:N-6 DNA methylase [Chloroflexota bacterium]